MRQCGECNLCCKLLPMSERGNAEWPETLEFMHRTGVIKRGEEKTFLPDFDKPAGKPCPHQKHHKGCTVYRRRPFGCRVWSCRWLVNDDTADMHRPDRAHYVVDMVPDFIEYEDEGRSGKLPVIQIWVDAGYTDVIKDRALRDYIFRRGAEGYGALIRFNEQDGYFIAPPQLSADGQWHEIRTHVNVRGHTAREKAEAMDQAGVQMSLTVRA